MDRHLFQKAHHPMSQQTALRPGDVTVTVTIVATKGVTAVSWTVLTAKELAAGDPSRLIQMAADLDYVKCQQIANAPELVSTDGMAKLAHELRDVPYKKAPRLSELAIAPSPEKPERDLRAEFELNRKAAKMAGVIVNSEDHTCYRLDGKEWNPLLNSTDCRHVIASTPLGYAVDGSHRLQITGRQGSAIRTGSVGGFDNPENRKMVVKACVEWHENDRNYY